MTETFAVPLPPDVDAAATRVLARACDAGLTVATAESCTGGLVAAVLTDVEGCSHAFVAGLVTYTDDAKTALLGVDAGLIARAGAVSAPVAIAMAEGALARTGADVALAVTGFAGPAGPGDEPGLVHLAAARTGRPTLQVERHYGDIGRGRVRMACLRTLLDLLDARLD